MSTTTSPSFTLEELLSHRVWAQRLARRLVGPADADDLVQDGWVASLVSRPADRTGLRPWLATVLGRAAAHRRRDHQRRSAREQAGSVFAQAAVPAPEALVAQVEVERLLAELVLALEPPVRDVILLRFYQGLTSPEIACVLAVPEGTVRWRIKVGLDELRQRLDQRQGGHEVWLGVLAPIAGRGTRRPVLGPALALTAGALLVAGIVLWTVARPASTATGASVHRASALQSPTAIGIGPPGATPPGTAGMEKPPGLAAVATGDECHRRLTAVRQQLAANEVEFVETARVRDRAALFELGAPNPDAEAVITPLLTRVLEAVGAAKPAGHRLTCRTWICRLTLLVAADAPTFDWQLTFRQDADLSERAPSVDRDPAPSTSVEDPLARAKYREETFYLRLWNPAAEGFSRANLIALQAAPKVTPPVFGPLPAKLEACRAELGAAEQHLKTMLGVIERHMLPERRWERSPRNRALTAEMDALARKILALLPASQAVTVECRHDVCRVDFDRRAFPGTNDWKRLFTPEWRRRTGRSSLGAWRSFFTIVPQKPAESQPR